MDPEQSKRQQLHDILLSIVSHVYFQPPSNVTMQYPCIVYEYNDARSAFADNKPYRFTKGYQLTVIDPDPDGDISDKVAQLPMCSFNRHFAADNLNHDVYDIFF